MTHATTLVPARLAALIRRHASALARHVAAALEGAPDPLHDARVASRRLREVLPIAGEAAGGDLRARRREIRRVTRALGGVRELDVAGTGLAAAAARWRWPPTLVARLERVRTLERQRELDRAVTRLGRVSWPRLFSDLEAMAASTTAAPDLEAANARLASRIRRRAQRLTAALAQAGTVYAPEQLHTVRIATKKLRYVLEIARDGARVPTRREVARLKALQTLLGGLHDLQFLQTRLHASAAAPGTTRATTRKLEEGGRQIETTCRRVHARFVRQLPALIDLARTIADDAPLRLVRRRPRRMGARDEESMTGRRIKGGKA